MKVRDVFFITSSQFSYFLITILQPADVDCGTADFDEPFLTEHAHINFILQDVVLFCVNGLCHITVAHPPFQCDEINAMPFYTKHSKYKTKYCGHMNQTMPWSTILRKKDLPIFRNTFRKSNNCTYNYILKQLVSKVVVLIFELSEISFFCADIHAVKCRA